MPFIPAITRRQLLARSLTITVGAALAGLSSQLLADELATLDVAYAGSMGSLMEGPLKSSAAQILKLYTLKYLLQTILQNANCR